MNQLELLLQRKGRQVTLRNYSKTGESEYGNTTYDASEQTISGFVERQGDADFVYGATGSIPEGEARFYVSSDYDYYDNQAEKASQVDIDSQTWEVMQVAPKSNGLTVLKTERVT